MNDNLEMISPQKSKYSFSRIDFFAALISLVFGYLFVLSIPVGDNPLGAMIYFLLLYGLTVVFIYRSGRRPDGYALAFGGAGVLLSAGFILSSVNIGWLFFAEILLYIYFVYSAFGNRNEEGIGRWFWFDAVKSATIMPFSALDALVRALVPGKKEGATRKVALNVLWIFIGLLLAIVPTLIISLLLSYDAAFEELMEKISDAFDISNIADVVWDIILAVPVALYGFGQVAASKFGMKRERYDAEECLRVSERAKFLPAALSCGAMFPVLAVYVIFFISQWGMYMSAFTGVLPESMTYSEYARQGFFQLCIVCGINLALMFGVGIFTNHKSRTADIVMRTVKVITSVFSIILAITALSKMILYIDAYGLTLKRVLSSWLIIVFLLVFVLVIIYQFRKSFRFNAALVLVLIVMIGGLMLCDLPSVVAEYNVEAYLSGELGGVDFTELYYECEDSGIPSIVRLAEEALDSEVRDEARLFAERYYEKVERQKEAGDRGFFSFSIPRARAEKAVEKFLK